MRGIFMQQTRNAFLIVTNAQSEISPNRPAGRKSIYIRNMDAAGNTITIVFSDAQGAAVNAGIPLRPYDYIIDCSSENYECWQGAITAIGSGASAVQNLSVFERVDI
jgi:hypothetical protein